MRQDRVLWLLLLLGAGLRLWKIGGDLPFVFHYDEPTLVDNAVWLLQHQTLNPRFFHYPTGMIYLLAALFSICLAGGLLVGRFGGWAEAIAWVSAGTYPRPPEGGVLYFYPTFGVPTLYLIGRVVSVVAGVFTIPLVYALARRCARNRATARLAALLVAVSPLAVEHAHLVTTDTLATALATGVLLVAARAEEGGARRWILGGFLGGLAAGVKYNTGLVVVSLVLLVIWCRGEGVGRAVRRLTLAAIAAVLAFLITTPYALLDRSIFLRDLGHEFRRIGSVAVVFEGAETVEATAVEKVGAILYYNLGILGIVAALWGGLTAVLTRRYVGAAVVLWILISLLPQLQWHRIYPRYLLPVLPAILLLVAWGTSDLATRAGRVIRKTRGVERSVLERSVLVLLSAVVLVSPAIRLIERESCRARPDPRIEMTRWIEAHVPEGETIVLEPGGPFPSPERYTLEHVDFIGRSTPEGYRSRGVRYLVRTGRERRVRGEQEFGGVFENLRRIREESERRWAEDRYEVYFLGGVPLWEEEVHRALAVGDRAGAREVLEREVRAGGGNFYVWKRLGEVRADVGDTAAAVEAYGEASRVDSSDVEVPLALSNLYLAMSRWDEALDQLDRARRLAHRDPLVFHNSAVAHLYRARNRIRRGEMEGARNDWRAARDDAARCAQIAPGDTGMVEILHQVELMGRRWGFVR